MGRVWESDGAIVGGTSHCSCSSRRPFPAGREKWLCSRWINDRRLIATFSTDQRPFVCALICSLASLKVTTCVRRLSVEAFEESAPWCCTALHCKCVALARPAASKGAYSAHAAASTATGGPTVWRQTNKEGPGCLLPCLRDGDRWSQQRPDTQRQRQQSTASCFARIDPPGLKPKPNLQSRVLPAVLFYVYRDTCTVQFLPP